eukprot:1482806-Rhodomonas_salina.1
MAWRAAQADRYPGTSSSSTPEVNYCWKLHSCHGILRGVCTELWVAGTRHGTSHTSIHYLSTAHPIAAYAASVLS